MKLPIELIIFDLDGVIVSTDELHYIAWKRLADEEHIYFDKTINNRLRGVSRMASLDIVLERANRHYTDIEKQKLADLKNNYYRHLLLDLAPKDILPNVYHVLEALKQANIKIAIGSSSKNTMLILKQIGLATMFDFISDGNNIQRSKPFPDVFAYVTNALKIDPKHTIVIEDASAGIQAANAAGMLAAGISTAYDEPLADYHLVDITDLLTILEIKN